MSLSRDTWHKHDDELIEAICREFGLVKPLAMEGSDGALCCASIAEAEPGACRFASERCLTNCLIFLAKIAQSSNLSAVRLNSRSNQWTSSAVPEPFFFLKGEASPSQSHPPRVCFPGGQKESTLFSRQFSNRFFVKRAAFDVKVGRCAVEFARKRLEPPLARARRKR